MNLTKNVIFQKSWMQILEERKQKGEYRCLLKTDNLIDFCSNDYLGFSRSALLRYKINEELSKYSYDKIGATGSRLISGNSEYIEALESFIGKYHNNKKALIFNSGFDANLAVFSTLPQSGDLILYDELVHASIRQGIKLSRADAVFFTHNQISDLNKKLKMSNKRTFISIESLYSMDGDFAPLEEIAYLAKQYNAYLIVDEAHATGLYGKNKTGLCEDIGVEDFIFLSLHTYGKALGTHGASVICNSETKDFLINYAKPFIYTTALPFHSQAGIKCAYDILSIAKNKILKINSLISLFKKSLAPKFQCRLLPSDSPIQSIVISDLNYLKSLVQELMDAGIYAKAIVYPTVDLGKERIRFCFHSFNSIEEVNLLVSIINKN